MCCPWWSIISNKQVSYIQANYVLERKKKNFSKQPNKWIFRGKQNSAKEILNITWNVDLFCVFKKELDAGSCIKKKVFDVVLFQKTQRKRWRLLDLGQVNDDNFLNWELELMVQWYIWTKTTYPVQPPAYGNTGVWVSHSCRNPLPNSAFCWLIPCVFPVSLSTKEMQHCHFNAAFWPALTSSFKIWRQNRDYPKHWILSTFSVKKIHYRALVWPVCV